MKVDLVKLTDELKKEVTEKRFIHTLGVVSSARTLASIYGEDPEKAEIASILHDFAKSWSVEKMKDYILQSDELAIELLNYSDELWHGPVASIIAKQKFGIIDAHIINAIRYHTSGREDMSMLEKIICLADYIEPSRSFDGVEKLRELAQKDLNIALLHALNGTIENLIKNNKKIYPLTILARNSLLGDYKEENSWD